MTVVAAAHMAMGAPSCVANIVQQGNPAMTLPGTRSPICRGYTGVHLIGCVLLLLVSSCRPAGRDRANETSSSAHSRAPYTEAARAYRVARVNELSKALGKPREGRSVTLAVSPAAMAFFPDLGPPIRESLRQSLDATTVRHMYELRSPVTRRQWRRCLGAIQVVEETRARVERLLQQHVAEQESHASSYEAKRPVASKHRYLLGIIPKVAISADSIPALEDAQDILHGYATDLVTRTSGSSSWPTALPKCTSVLLDHYLRLAGHARHAQQRAQHLARAAGILSQDLQEANAVVRGFQQGLREIDDSVVAYSICEQLAYEMISLDLALLRETHVSVWRTHNPLLRNYERWWSDQAICRQTPPGKLAPNSCEVSVPVALLERFERLDCSYESLLAGLTDGSTDDEVREWETFDREVCAAIGELHKVIDRIRVGDAGLEKKQKKHTAEQQSIADCIGRLDSLLAGDLWEGDEAVVEAIGWEMLSGETRALARIWGSRAIVCSGATRHELLRSMKSVFERILSGYHEAMRIGNLQQDRAREHAVDAGRYIEELITSSEQCRQTYPTLTPLR